MPKTAEKPYLLGCIYLMYIAHIKEVPPPHGVTTLRAESFLYVFLTERYRKKGLCLKSGVARHSPVDSNVAC